MTALSKLNDYGLDFQLKIISLLIIDKKFLLNTANGIKVEYFENESHQWLVQHVLGYFHKYHTTVSKDYLDAELKKIGDGATIESIKLNIKRCYDKRTESIHEKEWIESEFKQFCRNQALKNAILESAQLLNTGDFDRIVSLVSSAAKITSENNIGKDAKRDLESVLRDEDRKATPFAFDVLTKLTRGGYGAGDLVLFVGSPGGGKTTMIIANMVHALKLGRTVVHYTLELTEDYTLRKYYACLIDVDVETLGNADVRVDLEEALAALPGRLIVKEYSPKRESFRTIETHLQQLKDHEECIPDVMVIDYLDYIRSYTTRSEKKDELDDVYIQAKGLAKELRIPIISPSQANRTAANSAIIEGSALAGSYDKLMIADMVFSLARTTNDKNAGIGRLHVMKNRYGRDGSTYMCEIDIARNYIAVSDEPMTEEEIQNSDKIPRKQIKKVEDQLRQLFET